jgi:tetratricopeptide (TPR) repeat protein
MMTFLSLLIALLIELFALYGLIFEPSAHPLANYLLYHGIATLFFSVGFQVFILPYFRHARWILSLSVFSLIFLVPMGWLLMMAVLLALLYPKQQSSDYSEVTERRSLPFEPFKFSDAPHQGIGGLGEIIKHAVDPLKRQMAVMALNNVANRDAIPLLKIALSDTEDDVRLLAYARLDHLENEMNHQIHHYQKALASLDDTERANFHRLIAEQLWELSYLGLSEGETQRYHLEQALQHVNSSLTITESAGLRLLLGRIYLALGQCELAEEALIAAQAAGDHAKRVLPYLAEVAFRQKQYSKVVSYLSKLETDQSALHQLKEYWL